MLSHLLKITAFIVVLGILVIPEQEILSQSPAPQQTGGADPNAAAAPAQDGVNVQERGPVHEAFAAPTTDPKPGPLVAKKPPANINEMPPEEKPDGNAIWIGGYWAWDDERNDYMWVSGCWRVKPPGKEWVPGYWRETEDKWQWVGGFWANSAPPAQQQGQDAATPTTAAQNVTYYPEPPAPPAVAPPPAPPSPDMFWVPGAWVWYNGQYLWRAGYWQTGRAGYIWVASYYRWTPYGYIFVPGYWDMAVATRGVLYAPVYFGPGVVGVGFVYTPAYAVSDAIILNALFIRPAYGHYYFGNYYGPAYVGLGFQSSFVYGRRYYEPIVAYQVWTYRRDPAWLNVQINLVAARSSGRAPFFAREVIVRPGREVIVARGQRVVNVPMASRVRAMEVARAAHTQAVQQRLSAERPMGGRPLSVPRQATLHASTAHTPTTHMPTTHTPLPSHTFAPNHNPPMPGGYRPSAFGSGGRTQPGGAGGRPGVGPSPHPALGGHAPARPAPRQPQRREKR